MKTKFVPVFAKFIWVWNKFSRLILLKFSIFWKPFYKIITTFALVGYKTIISIAARLVDSQSFHIQRALVEYLVLNILFSHRSDIILLDIHGTLDHKRDFFKFQTAENGNRKMFKESLINILTFWHILYIKFHFLSNRKFILSVRLHIVHRHSDLSVGTKSSLLLTRYIKVGKWICKLLYRLFFITVSLSSPQKKKNIVLPVRRTFLFSQC